MNTITSTGMSCVPGARVPSSAERKKAADWNRPQPGQLTGNEMFLLDAVLRHLPEGEDNTVIYLDGHPDTVRELAALHDGGFIRFVAPVALGMAAIIARPSMKR